MRLDKDVNYIVSGLERSGTSMIMQILHAGKIPVGFDQLRESDTNNPNGYYELDGGKIINRLMDGDFPLELYKGKFIKITSYGIKFLPPGKYKIIYSTREIDEIMDSMEKMIGEKDDKREDTKKIFIKLNDTIKELIQKRQDIEPLFVNYNKILEKPDEEIKKMIRFLNLNSNIKSSMIQVIDPKLYRQRKKMKK